MVRLAVKLHFGCGRDIREGYVNVDKRRLAGVDLVMDLEGEWPWKENSVDLIVCNHVLEHVHDLIGFMDKAHVVITPGGELHIRVPHHRHINADTDPTHVRRFTEFSFDYWYPESTWEGFSDLKWKCLDHEVVGGLKVPLLWKHFYSLRDRYLITPYEISWVLTPLK